VEASAKTSVLPCDKAAQTVGVTVDVAFPGSLPTSEDCVVGVTTFDGLRVCGAFPIAVESGASVDEEEETQHATADK